MSYIVKMNIFFIFILLFIKLSYSVIYIDLKNKYISPGVIVHHGYFLEQYKYKMFVGENASLELVRYGNEILFRDMFPNKKYINTLVEYFQYNYGYIIIHCHEKLVGGVDKYSKLRYIIFNGIVNETSFISSSIINSNIFITLDINPRSYKHPFIQKTEKNYHGHFEVTFSVINEFRGEKLDSSELPLYSLGYVLDSAIPLYVLFTKFEYIVKKCSLVKIIISENSTELNIRIEHKDYKFIKGQKSLKYQWSYSGEISELFRSEWRMASIVYRKIVTKKSLSNTKIVDIGDGFSLELNEIDRISGNADLIAFNIYQPKIGSDLISSVIDTGERSVIVFISGIAEYISSVEVFVDHEFKYVILRTYYINDGRIVRNVSIYGQKETGGYDRIDDPKRAELLGIVDSIVPHFLNIDIDHNSTKLYHNVRLNDDIFNFNYYYIPEFDECDKEFTKKFRIGALSEINPFEVGNIPNEKFKKEYRIIKEDIDCLELLLLNPFPGKPMSTSSYEIYKLINEE